ncbi:MAG: radical SAM protein [Pseudomonadota bacterium]
MLTKLLNNLHWVFNGVLSREELSAQKIHLTSRPQFLIVDPTSRCNARCVMCYQSFHALDNPGSDLPLAVFKKIAPLISTASHINLFSTGEPSLAKEIEYVLKETQHRASLQAEIWTSTNGKNVTEAMLCYLIRPQMGLQFSVDGGTKEVFENIRRGISFEELCSTLKRVNQRKGNSHFPRLSFSSCISKRNIHDLRNIFRLAQKYHVEQVIFYEEDPEVPEENDYILDEDDRNVFLEQLPTIEETKISYQNGLTFQGSRRFSTQAEPVKHQGQLSCLAPWKVFHLRADGTVRVCCTLRQVMGNLSYSTFDEVWNGAEYVKLRHAFVSQENIPSTCCNCSDPLRTWGEVATHRDRI